MDDTGSCNNRPILEASAEGRKASCRISADAAPFTPRNSILTVTRTKTLSPDAPEFYPRNYAALLQNGNGVTSVTLKDPLNELKQTIAVLIDRPADFDQVMAPLVQSLTTNIRDEVALASIVEELFTRSVVETNFHYTGSRVCSYLSEHLKLPFGSFHQSLITRCQAEHSHLLTLSTLDGRGMLSIIGYTLFMGELLLSMKDLSSGQFIQELPQQMTQLLVALLNYQTPESIHCAVQVLKLTGAVLEDNMMNLNEIFSQLAACSLAPTVAQSIRSMISGVIELRASNWGRREEEVAAAAGAGDTRNYIATDAIIQSAGGGPVYYDCNNHIYPVDETEDFEGYNNWSAGADGGHGNNPSDQNAQYWIGDQEMDADTATAFEQFMAESQVSAQPNYWAYHP